MTHEVEQASYTDRDLILSQSNEGTVDVGGLRDEVVAALPEQLRAVAVGSWGYQVTQVAPDNELGLGLTLTGQGVNTEPDGEPPIVALREQSDFDEQVRLVSGSFPATGMNDDAVEFMVSMEVARAFGLAVGDKYVLAGLTAWPPAGLTARLSGVFVAVDENDRVWQHTPMLLESGHVSTQCPACIRHLRAELVTDRAGFDALFAGELDGSTEPLAGVRTLVDAHRISAAEVSTLTEAVARMQADPRLGQLRVQSGLVDLLGEFERKSAAARAVMAVSAVGIVSILGGLLILVARLSVDRRQQELNLLRARGASAAGVFRRLAVAALPWSLAGGLAGWGLSRLLVGDAATGAELVPALLVALLVWLTVPAATLWVTARRNVVESRTAAIGANPRPASLLMQTVVLALAIVGLVMVHRRESTSTGADPLLVSVPVLMAIAVGLFAVRVYRWPLRGLLVWFRRQRGAAGFLGVARATRGGRAPVWSLLVLVLAVAFGGFAAAMSTGVADARDEHAKQEVGAHVRIMLPEIDHLPDGLVEAVRQVKGVEALAVAQRGGAVRHTPVRHDHGQPLPRSDIPGVEVVVVEVDAYQQVLASLGIDVPLPAKLSGDAAHTDAVPVLTPPQVADRVDPTVEIGTVERSLQPVGDVVDLPGPDRHRTWILVPRGGWPLADQPAGAGRQPAQVSSYELLVAGADSDPAALHATVSHFLDRDIEVTSLADYRSQLDESGFNLALTLILVVGVAAGVIGCVLSIVMASAISDPSRVSTLSLLRTMGLSASQVRTLLLVETLPRTTVAVLAGIAAGVATPRLFGSALGVTDFTGGVPVTFQLEPTLAAGFVLFVIVSAGVTVMAESWIDHRRGLSEPLRVG